LAPCGFILWNDGLKCKLGEMYQYALHLNGLAVLNIKMQPKTGQSLLSFNKTQMYIMKNAKVPLLFQVVCYN